MDITHASYDLVIVGYGPTGLTLASLLGQKGHRIAVVERWPELYGLPRLTHIDGETARLISLAGDGDHALREAWATPHYFWTNGKGQLLLDVAEGNERRMLWDDNLSVHQPHIEEAIHAQVLALPNVRLYRGYAATGLEYADGGVQLTIQPTQPAQGTAPDNTRSIRLDAKYLVGSDGSRSFVRNAIGVKRTDFGFNERWMCVDTEPQRELPTKFGENAVQVCDPRRGYMFMPIGRKRQRFEFCVLPGEETKEMEQAPAAWRLLEKYHGLGPDDLKIIRQLVYAFECRAAERWRVGPVFLAGDAAHTNPPYLGQGACSGMRDAANLAWKFDLVLRRIAPDSLLDTYEQERRPHAEALMLGSRSLGLIANTANPIKAAVRDLMFRFKLTPAAPKFPTLTDGVLQHDAQGKLVAQAGSLADQGRLVVGGQMHRFDQHAGFRFTLLFRTDPGSALSETLRDRLGALDARIYVLGQPSGSGLAHAEDVDGKYLALLDTLEADAVLLRPDFVIYGHTKLQALSEFLQSFYRQFQVAPAIDRRAPCAT